MIDPETPTTPVQAAPENDNLQPAAAPPDEPVVDEKIEETLTQSAPPAAVAEQIEEPVGAP